MSVASRATTVTGWVHQSLSIIFKDHASWLWFCGMDFCPHTVPHVFSESSPLSAYTLMTVTKSPFPEWLLRGVVDFPECPGRHLSGLTGPNWLSGPFLNMYLWGNERPRLAETNQDASLASRRGLCFHEVLWLPNIWINSGFGRHKRRQATNSSIQYTFSTVYSTLAETFIFMFVKELAHRIMCFKRKILSIFTMTPVDTF